MRLPEGSKQKFGGIWKRHATGCRFRGISDKDEITTLVVIGIIRQSLILLDFLYVTDTKLT
ncbi:hypothetical protein [Oryza sativa Japonica Group]|uniref:Uncharacterized protein n=1 Tax=Oryza sativa subsp. japonica TaxID=39947 RepID=Q5JMU6_ORYSJ|nr:hypothetical protein [Oryza sativa Japonica Group]